MQQDLARTRLWSWFLDKVDLMIGIVECSDIRFARWLLVWTQDPESGIIEDFAGTVDISETAVWHDGQVRIVRGGDLIAIQAQVGD